VGRPICGKMEKSIPNLIFGLTRILEIKSRIFWGQEGLVKIPKILQNFIGILEMKRCELSEFWSTRKWKRFSRLPRIGN
jgi:hypothetical protein